MFVDASEVGLLELAACAELGESGYVIGAVLGVGALLLVGCVEFGFAPE